MSTTTIAALATAPAPAGLAIVRVSGPDTKRALRAAFRSTKNPVKCPRELLFGEIIDHRNKEVIDRALAVFMPGPKSFTGEDVAEFHIHGSPLLASRLLRSLFAFGIAPAEPGEFSKRGFLNGKMDLLQAEAICDVIEATSDRALQIASDQLSGKLSSCIEELGEPLRDTLAEIEANIDFPEEDIDPDSTKEIQKRLKHTHTRLTTLIDSYQYGEHIKEGYRVLLCGAPNAGKSSLLNALLEKRRAIVTDVSGTTRDILEEETIFKGYRFIFCDSAGLHETEDKVEKIGIELAKERVGWADLVLLLVDASTEDTDWQKALDLIKHEAKNIWMVINKIDLVPDAIGKVYCPADICHQNFYISVEEQSGIAALKEALVSEVSELNHNNAEDSAIITRERHYNCLKDAEQALSRSLAGIKENLPLEIISAELRIALTTLEELIGKTSHEDILGRIFSKFCIGK